MLPRPRRLAGPLALAGVLGALFSADAARAQVTVVAAPVTSTGGIFNYSYTITNVSADDLLILNINSLPMVPGALTNLTAPAGFQATFDPGVGIASFLPALGSTQDFAPGSVLSGFSFSSTFAPGTVPFDTEGINFATGVSDTFIGTTSAPVVPEASTLISMGAGVLLLTFCVVRRRRAARVGVRS